MGCALGNLLRRASATIAFLLTEDWGRRMLDFGMTDSKRDGGRQQTARPKPLKKSEPRSRQSCGCRIAHSRGLRQEACRVGGGRYCVFLEFSQDGYGTEEDVADKELGRPAGSRLQEPGRDRSGETKPQSVAGRWCSTGNGLSVYRV